MRTIYDIHFLAISHLDMKNGKGRCYDVEEKLQVIADNSDAIMCISPLIMPAPASKIQQGLGRQVIAGLAPGFMVVSMHLEEEPEKKEGEQCPQSNLQKQA